MKEKTTVELEGTSDDADPNPHLHPQRTAGKQATQPSGLRWHGAPVSGSQANASWSPEVTPAFSSDAANAHSMMASRDTRQGWARERPSLASGTPALLLRMKEPHSPARVGHLPEKAWPGWDRSYCGPAPCACCPPGPPPPRSLAEAPGLMKLSLLLTMARQRESKGDEGTKVTGPTGP